MVCPTKLQSVSTLTSLSNKTTECVYSHWSVHQNYRVCLLLLVYPTRLQSVSTLTGLVNKNTECIHFHWSGQQDKYVATLTGLVNKTSVSYSHWSTQQGYGVCLLSLLLSTRLATVCLLLSLVGSRKLQSVSTHTGLPNKTTECVYSHWSLQQDYRVCLLSLI